MNTAVQSLAPPPETSKLQPLFRRNSDASGEEPDEDLQPFFSEEGETPWGDVVRDVAGSRSIPAVGSPVAPAVSVTTNPAGSSILSLLQNASKTAPVSASSDGVPSNTMVTQDGGGLLDSLFMTDAQITARSQAAKAATMTNETRAQTKQQRREQYQQDVAFLQDWVARLPKPPVTKHFGEFKLDAEAIVEGALRRARQETPTM